MKFMFLVFALPHTFFIVSAGAGCQVTGFLTVFASQLSIYTLSILTLERWFAITYAIYLNKRLKLRAAARIMAAGWTYSVTMAALPLFGISSYSTTR
jgi:thyroid stimulating hormone receptor